MIPHGVPNRPFAEPDDFKARFGWDGRKVVLTFGLLAPSKGIETMIEALPAAVAEVPDLLYVVLGATHPNLVAHEGRSEEHTSELQLLMRISYAVFCLIKKIPLYLNQLSTVQIIYITF